jgi:hypothetical protein
MTRGARMSVLRAAFPDAIGSLDDFQPIGRIRRPRWSHNGSRTAKYLRPDRDRSCLWLLDRDVAVLRRKGVAVRLFMKTALTC